MSTVMPFNAFPKIPRLNRGMVITEKIDGTNAQVYVRAPAMMFDTGFEQGYDTRVEHDGVPYYVRAGSRNRWLTHGGKTDNFGFGRWVMENAHELVKLGPGPHFGEWWGAGIQRCYGIQETRVFSLFNVGRWGDGDRLQTPPDCCEIVPVLYTGDFSEMQIRAQVNTLRVYGSKAARGYTNPEGVVVYLPAANQSFKVLLENDDQPKGLAA